MTRVAITAPEGGGIHALIVAVDEHRNWKEAVYAGAPHTVDPKAFQAGPIEAGFFTTERTKKTPPGLRDCKIILVNFGKRRTRPLVLTWAERQRLTPMSAHACVAIGECHPRLNAELKMDQMIVATLGAPDALFAVHQNFVSLRFHADERKVEAREASWLWPTETWFGFVYGTQ